MGVLLLTSVVAAVLYFAFLAVSRRRSGDRGYHLGTALVSFVFAIFLNLFLVTTTITWTTTVLRQSLRMAKGGGRYQNGYLAEFLTVPDITSNFAILVPVITILCAHLVVGALFLGFHALPHAARDASAWIKVKFNAWQSRRAPGGATALNPPDPTIPAATPPASPWRKSVGPIPTVLFAACAAFASTYFYRIALGWEVDLLRYQLISESQSFTRKPREKVTPVNEQRLPADWAMKMSPAEVQEHLGSSFLGQLLNHAGAFYGTAVFICATIFVIALEAFRMAVRRIPMKYRPPTPPIGNGGRLPPMGRRSYATAVVSIPASSKQATIPPPPPPSNPPPPDPGQTVLVGAGGLSPDTGMSE